MTEGHFEAPQSVDWDPRTLYTLGNLAAVSPAFQLHFRLAYKHLNEDL